jgi:hypothetical protein
MILFWQIKKWACPNLLYYLFIWLLYDAAEIIYVWMKRDELIWIMNG